MQTHPLTATEVRVPEPARNEAFTVSRHGRRKAVIVNPEDFELFERLIEAFDSPIPYELRLGETELKLHRMGERGEDEDSVDYSSLKRALGQTG